MSIVEHDDWEAELRSIRDQCDPDPENVSVLCFGHMRPFTGHTDQGESVCDWYAGMWVHDHDCKGDGCKGEK